MPGIDNAMNITGTNIVPKRTLRTILFTSTIFSLKKVSSVIDIQTLHKTSLNHFFTKLQYTPPHHILQVFF